jgi:hypothetical protein
MYHHIRPKSSAIAEPLVDSEAYLGKAFLQENLVHDAQEN